MPSFPFSKGPLVGTLTTGEIDTNTADINEMKIPNLRATGTAEYRTFGMKYHLTDAEVDTLKTFYTTTLGKVGSFDWTHPNGETITVFMPVPPAYAENGHGDHIATLSMQEI